MVRKKFLYACTLTGACLFANSLHAVDVLVEGKAAYFYPTNNKFRKIYSGGGIYGAEIACQTWKGLYAWVSGDYFHKTGSSIGGHDSTKITIIPLGLGLKYLFPIKCVADLYLGAGVLGTYVHMRDHSHFVIQSNSKWGVGGTAKAGAIFNITRHLFIDLFTNYNYVKIGFHNTHHGKVVAHDANLSGWLFGGGIGYRFGAGCHKHKNSKTTSESKNRKQGQIKGS